LRIKGIIALALAPLICALTASTWVMLPRISFAEAAPLPIQMAVTINGLAQGESATLVIGRQTAELEVKDPLETYPIKGTGAGIREDITPLLEDGYYLLLLEAPGQYFREPKGWAFMVYKSTMVNPTGRSIIFDLKQQPSYPAVESVGDLSAPPKQPIPFTVTEPPLWQRLLEPGAIALAIIAAGVTGFLIGRLWSKTKGLKR
jgi:hypothetical protein